METDTPTLAAASDAKARHPVAGWRAFAVGEGGALLSPFLAHYWPDADPGWHGAEQSARCLAAEHPAPAADCTCGLRAVVSYPELLKAVERPSLTWRDSTPRSTASPSGDGT